MSNPPAPDATLLAERVNTLYRPSLVISLGNMLAA
jgi:hypothetical protein